MPTQSHIPSPEIHIAIVGGGAAGFFAALTAREGNPSARISIFEKSNQYLAKVKISGGGRCNVTHSCFDPAKLSTHYPRGSKELRGAFHRWQPQDMIDWFSHRGVTLKTESDGRMFPITDKSQTIIDCFMKATKEAKIELNPDVGIQAIKALPSGTFLLTLSNGNTISVNAVCIASGSLKQSPLTKALTHLGHNIEPLAPSLFAFNVKDERLEGLAGLSVQEVAVSLLNESKPQYGPILITHRGLSGPAILRTSAWEARRLQELNYEFNIGINWLGKVTENQLRDEFSKLRQSSGKATVRRCPFDSIPRRLWERLILPLQIDDDLRWAQFPKDKESLLINALTQTIIKVEGKTTNKDEFVTCGGISLKEVDFRRMESRIIPHLYFAGECLDIDGITGGFNFQAAWTTGRIAGIAMSEI